MILVPVSAMGQGAGTSELSEAEFLAALNSSHPAVVALSEQLARAEGDRRRAGTLDNPAIEFEFEGPADQADQSTLKLGWKPPLDGRRGLAIDAGEAAVEAASRNLEWAHLQVRQDMRAVFAEWAVAEQWRLLVSQHFESLRELEARLNVRAERGEESELAARRFALAVTEVRTELARSEADLARARGRALALRGDLPSGVVAVLPDPPAVPSTLDDTVRPDVLALRHEVEATTLRRRLAGRVLEFPTLVAGWTQISLADEKFDGPYFGVAWDLPLFDRNQGDRHETTRAIAIAEARLSLAERESEQRKRTALEAYSALHQSLNEVAGVVQGAPELVHAASASFLAGDGSMTDLLETLRSVMESQLAALELHAGVLAAHRELELSAGRALTRGDS
jgi:outer membrane protein TolC